MRYENLSQSEYDRLMNESSPRNLISSLSAKLANDPMAGDDRITFSQNYAQALAVDPLEKLSVFAVSHAIQRRVSQMNSNDLAHIQGELLLMLHINSHPVGPLFLSEIGNICMAVGEEIGKRTPNQ